MPVFRTDAEEALQGLNGSVIGKQAVRLSWGRSPSHKQVRHVRQLFFYCFVIPCYSINFHHTNHLAKTVSSLGKFGNKLLPSLIGYSLWLACAKASIVQTTYFKMSKNLEKIFECTSRYSMFSHKLS
jgi:hypothetical protein